MDSAPRAAPGPLTLAIDIGGSSLKAGVLDVAGTLVAGPSRVPTPVRGAPQMVLDLLVALAEKLGHFDRISVGFPGMVRAGVVLTAPNLDSQAWHGFALSAALSQRLGRPCRLLNDGTVQGLGVIAGHGLECVITLGTGMGFALFQDGGLTPQQEMGQHPIRSDKTYDHYVGNAAMRDAGRKRWNKRVHKVIGVLDVLLAYDRLYIGGGNAKYLDFEPPAKVQVVSNQAGITGGVRLWDAKLDAAFAHRAGPPNLAPATTGATGEA